MQKDIKSGTPEHKRHAVRAGVRLWLGRFLLTLSAISLLTSPLTQHLWTWDHFLRGGQDFEVAALMLFTALALVLVLSRQRRKFVDLLLAPWRPLTPTSSAHKAATFPAHWWFLFVHTGPVTGRACPFYSIPIQI